jgi:hypothetical protein
VTISWDDRLPPTPPHAGGAPWTGAVPPTPPPVVRFGPPRRRSGRVWLVVAALVVVLALVTAAYLVAAAS